MNESHYIFVYWIVGTFFDDVETLTLSVGLGAAKISPMANLVVAFVLFVVAVPSTTALTWLVPEHPRDIRKELESETASETDVEAHGRVVDTRRESKGVF